MRAIAHLLDSYPEEDSFVILEDDVAFDLVEFWPDALSELFQEVSHALLGWAVINLAPTFYLRDQGHRRDLLLRWAARTQESIP